MFSWIQFSANTVVDRKMGRAADRFVPTEREEVGDTDQSQWEVRDGELKDPWTFQHLLPLENLETGEVMVFTTSSIGGQIATEELVQQYAKRVRRQKSSALPIVRLAVKEMPTKKVGKVLRPFFEITGREDAPAASAASASNAMRTVNVDDVPDVPDLDPPPHDGDDISW